MWDGLGSGGWLGLSIFCEGGNVPELNRESLPSDRKDRIDGQPRFTQSVGGVPVTMEHDHIVGSGGQVEPAAVDHPDRLRRGNRRLEIAAQPGIALFAQLKDELFGRRFWCPIRPYLLIGSHLDDTVRKC